MNKKAVVSTHTFTAEHIEKLKVVSKETYISISGLIRKALDEFFEKYDKNKNDK
jgi:Tat protein secretion system quality control protein TatD with DNase activity